MSAENPHRLWGISKALVRITSLGNVRVKHATALLSGPASGLDPPPS